jgi:nitrogen fixation protein NifM
MTESGSGYLTLKLAAKLFSKPPEALAADELKRVRTVAARQREIEAMILGTPESANVMVPQASIEACLQEIRSRYGSEEDFQADLERIGLDLASLRQAVERDMVVEAVLDKVGARAAAVSDTEVEIFWFMHRERFRRAETRVLRHILVTINETLAGSERPAAGASIGAIRSRLLKDPARFAEQALKHSECPTAMNGGLLGKVPRGQLYPELEAAAFALGEGGLSEIVETELGYHLILCETIDGERHSRFDEVRQTIREHLEQQRRGICQKAWINSLRRQPA